MTRQEHRLELSLQAKLQLKAAGWRPPLLVAQANSLVQAKLLVTAAGWRPQLLEPQD